MTKRSKKAPKTEPIVETPIISLEELQTIEPPADLPDAPIDAEPDFIAPFVEPMSAELAAILDSIDESMETAVTSGVVDHESQASSWTPESVAAEAQLMEVVAALSTDELSDAPSDAPQPVTLGQHLAAVSNETVEIVLVATANAIDQRAADEAIAHPENDNIQKTIKKVRSQMVTKRAARLLAAINVPPSFVNRSVHQGAAYNVYALGKLADIVYGVTDGKVSNAINLACMRSLFAFNKAGVAFTMECAKGAASKNYSRVLDASVRKHLISHTVAPATAPTQASSTMQALVTLGVVATNGAGKNPTYTVLDSPIAHKLEAMLSAAA